jgi:hypothetical protein
MVPLRRPRIVAPPRGQSPPQLHGSIVAIIGSIVVLVIYRDGTGRRAIQKLMS